MAWFLMGSLATFLIVYEWTRNRALAFFVALAYAAHPLCVQGNLWLAERKNVMALAFIHLTIWRHLRVYINDDRDARSIRPDVPELFFYICAMISKIHAIIIPPILFFIDVMHGRGWRRSLVALSPQIAINIIFIALALMWWREDTSRPLLGGSLVAAIAHDGIILLKYWGQFFIPTELTLYYEIPRFPAPYWFPWACWGLIALIVYVSVRMAGSYRRLIASCWAWILIGLLPCFNLFGQLAIMTDYIYQYSLVPTILIFGTHAFQIANYVRMNLLVRYTVSLFLLVYLMVIAHAQVAYWRNPIVYYGRNVELYPDNALAWSTYLNAFLRLPPSQIPSNIGSLAYAALHKPEGNLVMLPGYRAALVMQAARMLQGAGRQEYVKDFLDRQCLLYLQGNLQMTVLADYALYTGRPHAVVALIEPMVDGLGSDPVDKLVGSFRDGIMPFSVPPVYGQKTLADSRNDFRYHMHFLLAEAYFRMGNHEDGLTHLLMALNLDRHNIKYLNAALRAFQELSMEKEVEEVRAYMQEQYGKTIIDMPMGAAE